MQLFQRVEQLIGSLKHTSHIKRSFTHSQQLRQIVPRHELHDKELPAVVREVMRHFGER